MLNRLKHGILIIATLLLAVGLSGCASSPKITSDYDRSADFSAYNTWDFMEDAGPDHEGYQSLFTQYMKEAITIEMNKRGYTQSANPDLYVNFNAVLQDKTNVSTVPAAPMMGGYYGYRGPYYGAWGGYGYGTETHVSQYTEGTFNIDLVDAGKNQLVWEGVGIGRISDHTRENMRERIMAGVPEFFANYPFVAGNATPNSGQ